MREVRLHLEEAMRTALAGLAKAARVPAPAQVPWAVPPEPALGDLSTPLALSFAPALGRQPREVAEEILRALTLDPGLIARAEVAGAGYLNFFVAPAYWRQVVRVVRREGPAFGCSRTGCGRPVQAEFVSANPTGLLPRRPRGQNSGKRDGNRCPPLGPSYCAWCKFSLPSLNLSNRPSAVLASGLPRYCATTPPRASSARSSYRLAFTGSRVFLNNR